MPDVVGEEICVAKFQDICRVDLNKDFVKFESLLIKIDMLYTICT